MIYVFISLFILFFGAVYTGYWAGINYGLRPLAIGERKWVLIIDPKPVEPVSRGGTG